MSTSKRHGNKARGATALVLGVVLATGGAWSLARASESTKPTPRLSESEARAIALKAVAGQVEDWELERERGGSGLRYSFDVRAKGVTHEVGIDARTGSVLENSVEGDHAD